MVALFRLMLTKKPQNFEESYQQNFVDVNKLFTKQVIADFYYISGTHSY